jgi:hypothetical protein
MGAFYVRRLRFGIIREDHVTSFGEPMTDRVSFPGVVAGRDCHASCTVSATEVIVPGVRIYFTAYSISDVSMELPDGEYQLLANGGKIPVTRKNGAWDIPEPGDPGT